MKSFLACLVVVAACSSQTDGPTPKITSVMPDPICDAQKAITLTITGTGFSPIVKNGLAGTPAVVMPVVRLIGPATVEVPTADVSTPDTTGKTLVVTIEQGSVMPGTYDVEVVDPDGNSGTLTGGLVIDPPPALTAVSPTFGLINTMVMLTLTGTDFRAGMTVTLGATPPVSCTTVVVATDGTSATCTLDLTNVMPGAYDLVVDNLDGCTSTLVMGFTVVSDEFTLSGIDPPFGYQAVNTPVTISTAGGEFVSTPRVEMRPAGQATPVYAMKRVAFVDANTITAVVPSGLPLGTYDVTVVNPPTSGRFGVMMNAFRVVSMPVPSIEQVVPDRGPPNTIITNATIYGNNFRTTAKVELLDRTGTVVATATTVTVNSATQITTTFTTPTTEDAYLVRVTDLDEMTYSTWSAFIVGSEGASGNLHGFTASSTLVTGRRMLAGVSARDDLGNTFIYAIGGDTGSGGTVLKSVEVAQLSKFGALAGWKQEKTSNDMATARDAASAVAVPLFGTDPYIPAKTYVYVTGGYTGTGTSALGTIERAVVLLNKDAPTISTIGASATAGTLAAGTWYYKVSAVMGPGGDNPNGESLPSDEEIITLASNQTAVDLTWTAVTGAASYRIYRTKMVDGVSQQEFLIASPAGTGTSYTDSGQAASNEPPLPPGSLGVWQTDARTIGQRWGHQAAVVTDNQGAAGGRSLYVLGGKSDSTTGFLDTIEYSPIDAATGALGAFVSTGTTITKLPTPLAFFSLVVETPQNVKGFSGDARFITTGGVDSTGASTEIEQSTVTDTGGNGVWGAPSIVGGLLSRAGVMSVIASDKLFVIGGAAMASSSPATTFSNVRSNGSDIAFDLSNGALTGNVNSATGTPARALAAPITGAGFIYIVGGSSTGSDATNTCTQTF